jgi:hypothetical protein
VRDSRQRGGKEATSWIIGAVLIALGVIFLLENAGYLALSGNWWALFIYLASIASLLNAWRSYRSHGGLGSAASGSLTWGLVLAVIASIFLFDLQWDQWWPAILIAVGLGIVVGYVLRPRGGDSEDRGEG